MASSRKPRSGSRTNERADERPDEVARAVDHALRVARLEGCRIVVAFSGGVDSVVLLHAVHTLQPKYRLSLRAVHVNHGLSPNASSWAQFCRRYCRALGVPASVKRVKISRKGKGLEAAAREARYAVLSQQPADAVLVAHHLDDQAETVLLNLLRGAGGRGASAMPGLGGLGEKVLLRPLLGISRATIAEYAQRHALQWIEDESNAEEALTRNFLRRRVGPLLSERFPRWRENLARAARHFAQGELDANRLLREFLRGKGLRAPSEAKLREMLRQLGGDGARTAIRHDGSVLRVYRGSVRLEPDASSTAGFSPQPWAGARRVELSPGMGEVRFRMASKRGQGLDPALIGRGAWHVQRRRGGERLQPDPRRPRRTLKNLFQEAGVPPWERDAMPLLFCGDDLVWAPGLGIDCRYVARAQRGLLPEWRRSSPRRASGPS
jgi:tRNA(Ile)-lysidine synthase